MNKVISAEQAAQLVRDDDVVTISSSSGLCCPDKVLAALGSRFAREGHPRALLADGLTVREIAPGVVLQRDILDQSNFELKVDPQLKLMESAHA